MRLDRFLSNSLRMTRSVACAIIKEKRVKVNGVIIRKKDFKIDEIKDVIEFDDKRVEYRCFVYYMLNKPKGVVSARIDNIDKTVVDLIDTDYKISPIGRLDKDTTGLLLLSNDGSLIHALTSPLNDIKKIYLVECDRDLSEEEMFLFENGIEIKDGDDQLFRTKKANIKKIKDYIYEVEISEGKFHQVKRMFNYFNSSVINLRRLKFANIKLDASLNEGEYRELTDAEVMLLKRQCNLFDKK